MEIMQIMSNARCKKVVFKPDTGPAQVHYFPVKATREDIATTLEEYNEEKKSRKRRKPEDNPSC